MPVEKIPIERGERTGLVAGALSRVVPARLAIVAHLIDVMTARAVGLRADNTAVAVLAHPERVRQRHPVDCIQIHGHMPFMKLARMNAEQERIQPDHHQPLNMVGIAVIQDAHHRLPDTIHLGLPMPIERGYVQVMTERVQPTIFRHMKPVDASHEFPPSQNLTDIALDALNRRAMVFISGHGRVDTISRAQQFQI